MKNLTVKIICLMMALPLLIIFATSTVKDVTEIIVDVSVSEVEITADNKNAEVNDMVTITAKVKPDTVKNKSITFSFKDEEGNAIDESYYEAEEENGENSSVLKFTGKKKMIVYVSATAIGGKTKSVKISFAEFDVPRIPPEEIVSLKEAITIEKGSFEFIELGIHYDILPGNATEYTEDWVSSDAGVATVSKQGRIDAKAAGECEVTLTIDKGRKNELSIKFKIVVK